MKTKISLLVLAAVLCCSAQIQSNGTSDMVQVQVGKDLPLHTSLPGAGVDGRGTPYHPVHYVARHPKPGCAVALGIAPPAELRPVSVKQSGLTRLLVKLHFRAAPRIRSFSADVAAIRQWETSTCGEIFAEGDTHNLRTSAGTTWEYGQLAGGTAAVGTYIGVTNSALTPAFADTTLPGEIASLGLSRALSTPANASTTLSVPAAGTASVIGTTGATTYNYWLAACNGGICTTVSATSNQITNANATLSTTNYNSVAFTGQLGASSYQMYRTTSGTPPSGTSSVLVGGSPACSTSTAGVVSCTWADVSNTLSSVTIPASNLTNFGKYTLTYTWTATGAVSAQGFAVFNASSSGTMIFEGTFTSVSLNTNDTLQLIESVYY